MTIFRTVTSGLATMALLGALSSSAFAGTIIISGHPDYRDGLGGEFNVSAADEGGATLLSALSGGYTTVNGTVVGTANGTRMFEGFGGAIGFQTFCVEYNEHISLPGTYTAAISDGAIAGGVAGGVGTPSTDLVSVGTAYLYSQFATGSLSGYTYVNGADRAISAVKLQEAIWYLEDEVSLGDPTQNSFLQLAFAEFGTPGAGIGNAAGGAKANSNGLYGVRVLNLGSTTNPNQNQDQLISVPDGGLTITLLGLGMGGLALMRRKLA